MAVLCREMNELAVSNIIIIFGKAMQQIRQMDKILDMAENEEASELALEELIFEEFVEEERSMVIDNNTAQLDREYNRLEELNDQS